MKLTNIILTICVFVLSLLPLRWLRGNEVILGYDAVYPLDPLPFLRDRLFSWSWVQNFGMDQSGVQGSLLIHAIDVLPQLIGLSPSVSQRIVYAFWFFLLLAAPYILAHTLRKYRLMSAPYAPFLFPVLYALNFYILQAWWVAERTKFSLVVATPLILAVIIPMLVRPLSWREVGRRSLLVAFILFIFNGGSWAGLSLYGGLLLVLAVFYLCFVAMAARDRRMRDIGYFHLFLCLTIIWVIALNAYTFLPFITQTLKGYHSLLSGAGGVSGQIGWARYLSENTSILNLLRLQGIPDWYNNGPYHPYAGFYLTIPILIGASFLFPLFGLVGAAGGKGVSRRLTIFFLTLFLVSLFFTAGVRQPFGFVFEFFMRYVPGFVIFRSPVFKFGYAYWLAASFIVAVGLSQFIAWLAAHVRPVHLRESVGSAVTLLAIGAIVAYHFPYLTGDIFRIAPAPVGTRVVVPPYVGDFAQWWKRYGNDKKILLLPRTNANWQFEQYRWGYMSLFPLLGNFGARGLVENLDYLTGKEDFLIAKLYDAIEERDYRAVDELSQMFGVQYFLLRRDFYHDLPDQETSDPKDIENSLTGHPGISLMAEFGPWIVYGLKQDNPFIYGVSPSGITIGDRASLLFFSSGMSQLHYLDSKSAAALDLINQSAQFLIRPVCLSCAAERTSLAVRFPAPRILPSSPFYRLVELKKLWRPKTRGEASLYSLIGDTLKYAGELVALMNRDERAYIDEVVEKYRQTMRAISDEFDRALGYTGNPYLLARTLAQYLKAQDTYLYINAFSVRREDLIATGKILSEMQVLRDKIERFYGEKDINVKKAYTLFIPLAGQYSLIPVQSSPEEFFFKTSGRIFLDDAPLKPAESVWLSEGKHTLTLELAQPKNLLALPVEETIIGSKCFSSYVGPYSPDAHYRLQFSAANTFSGRFFFFVDYGATFSPILAVPFSDVTGIFEEHEYVISPDMVPAGTNPNTLRIAFCSPELTRTLYLQNVKDLALTELSEPLVFFARGKREEASPAAQPEVSYRQVLPTEYLVSVSASQSPSFLVMNARYSPDWKAELLPMFEPVAEVYHVEGDGYNNVWRIDREGELTLRIHYQPQQYVWIGVGISAVSLLLGVVILAASRHSGGKT